MGDWLIGICVLLCVGLGVLVVKVYLMKKSAREIREKFAQRLNTDTNTLIDISTSDSDMRKLTESLNDGLRMLRKERRRLMQEDRELKETITHISHDLRTPLTAICGYLDLLCEEDKSEKADEYLAMIENRTEALRELTEELFRCSVAAYTLSDSGFSEVILNHVLEESISGYYAALKAAQISPDISMPEKKICRRLDKAALSRIFGNIISNAIKYSDGDLKVALSCNGEITFANHAAGLDEIQVEQFFGRFYTVETGRHATGLGLSIAKMLTEQMNGEITAEYDGALLCIRIRFL